MSHKLNNIRIVAVALLVVAALATGADLLYFSDLEWRFRTALVDSRLSSLENEAERLLELTEKEIEGSGDVSELFRGTR